MGILEDDVVEPDLDQKVLFRIENQVAWITINNPEKGNALTPGMRDRIGDCFLALNGRFEARAVVLTAAGDRQFCTGADISVPRPWPERPEGAPEGGTAIGEARRMMLKGQLRLMPTILECELPVIAAVNGTAAGVGVHLALCCDLVLMADNARFIEVFVRRGLVPDGLGTWILPRLVGLQKAKELMFFGDDVSAEEAARIGLCNKVVPKDELISTATVWAERLAAGPTKSLMMSKWLLNRSTDVDRHTIAEEEAWAVELVNRTADSAEGVASFVERRSPEWRGW